jgi:long-chain acyl-CoA synthetase
MMMERIGPAEPSRLTYPAFKETARQHPKKTAIHFLGSSYSYSQVKEWVDNLGASLYQMGMRQGDRAILYISNLPQWFVAFLALQRIGAVAVPITPFYAASDLRYIANDCEAETIFCMDTNFGYVSRVQPETSMKRVIVTTTVELLPLWKRFTARALSRGPEGRFRLDESTHAFRSLLRKEAYLPSEIVQQPEDLAEILYTGGTMGYPKGVPINQGLFMQSAIEHRQLRENLIPWNEDILIQGGGLYHILGQALGLGSILLGDTVVLLARINFDAIFDHIQRLKATSYFGVPTVYRMILEHDRIDQYDLSSLRFCFSGGDVLPVDVARMWLDKFGQPIYEGYGATETCGGIAVTPAGEPFPEGTAGKILSFQRVKVVDPVTLEEVPPNEPGEALVSSDRMVSGYINKPEETAAFFVQIDGRQWYRTGDIVRINQDGWLFFVDRTGDIIKHKGYRVSASRVEAALQGHPAVIAASVIGVPDPDLGERIKAFVVLKEDVRGVTAYDLIARCREVLAPYEVPYYIEMRDMLPKSKVGKVLRRELRADEQRKQEIE